MSSNPVSIYTFASSLCLGLLVLFSIPVFSVAAQGEPMIAENTINIAFDLDHRTVTGTSRIILPPDMPLTLYCGNLVISATLLEKAGQTPMVLKPSDSNLIRVPPADVAQTLYISWTLVVPEHGEATNLISTEGITLAGLWHPVPDIDMRYSLEALLPDNFTGITEGETLVYCKDKTDNRYLSATFDHPVRSINFAAGPYTVTYRKMDNGITLAAFFFEEDLGLAEEYLDKTASYISRYEKLIGPYPYSRYSIVENRLPTGFGMPTYTLLGQAVVRLPFIKDTSLGHEILHSWFGNSVHLDDTGGNWCEGLTTYLADQLYAEEQGNGIEYRKNQLLRYGSYVHPDNSMTLEQFVNASDSQPMARQVRAIGYDKASMVFHMLRVKLGDDRFYKGLQEFYRKMRFTRAGWLDLQDSFTNVADTDLTGFFDQWLSRLDIPKLEIDKIDVSQKEGKSVITFTVKQKSIEPYELDLPVAVQTRTGETVQTVSISGRADEVKITVDDLPIAMTIDPAYDLMRVLRREEEAATWSRFMGAKDKIVVLPPADKADRYAPLLPVLEELGSQTVNADELGWDDLEEGGFLFLGNSPQSLGIFADPNHAPIGFTLDVRKNPLAPDQVMALVTSSSVEETAAVARKLSHYGKYSYLYFEGGQAGEKRTEASVSGIRVELFEQPEGVRVPDIRSFDDILAELAKNRVVYVGEMHTDMGTHILQLQIVQALFQADPNLAIGMEMFPRSAQEVLDGYINGTIATEEEFLRKSDYFKVWGYDYRLYREIISYARRHQIPIIGLNINKEIVSQVFQDGSLDGLSQEQLDAIPAERKLDIPGYRDRLAQAFSSHDANGFTAEQLGGFLQAQSIWDETMAETIVRYLESNPDKRMVVIAGNGHVYKDTGIPPRVKRILDIPQSVVSSISYGNTGLETGYQMDYLLYTRAIELEPAPKVGVVLEVEKEDEDAGQARVRITRISPHGKAGEAGIKEQDIVLAVDNFAVHDINDIKIGIMDKRPGDRVTLRVLREHVLLPDEELELEVELSSPMNTGGMPPTHPK